jgi:hypothetical protein
MNSTVVSVPQSGRVTPTSSAPGLRDTLSQVLYDLISQPPFFKGLNPHQLQLLTDSALEMTALNQYNDER